MSSAHFKTGTRPSGGSMTIERRALLTLMGVVGELGRRADARGRLPGPAGGGALGMATGASNGVLSKLIHVP